MTQPIQLGTDAFAGDLIFFDPVTDPTLVTLGGIGQGKSGPNLPDTPDQQHLTESE